jgi:CheY-like chemotaxis protein
MSAVTICIAASNLMPSLRGHLAGEGDVVTFADTEPILALQAILDQRPRLIVLERLFAATPRGAALINRIKTDPQLGHAEVRVMSHTGDYVRQVVKPSVSQPAAARAGGSGGSGAQPGTATASSPSASETSRPLDWHGTRRAPRFPARPGVEIQLDGNTASVVDVSAVGAQVLSPTILRPNQKVRVTIAGDDAQTRFRGAIAWAKFELPKPNGAPRYRAGVEFINADGDAVDEFCAKTKA